MGSGVGSEEEPGDECGVVSDAVVEEAVDGEDIGCWCLGVDEATGRLPSAQASGSDWLGWPASD